MPQGFDTIWEKKKESGTLNTTGISLVAQIVSKPCVIFTYCLSKSENL